MECKSLRDSGRVLKTYDVTYFMASTDSLADVTGFAEKNEADFPILSDPDKSAAEAFGVLSGMGFAKRWTFYVNDAGIIQHIDKDVSPRTAGPDLAANLDRLGYPREEI